MTWLHTGSGVEVTRSAGDYVGSPLYGVLDEHGAALALVALLPIGAALLRRSRARWSQRAVTGYRALPSRDRLVAWLLAVSAAAHLGLVMGHEWSALSAGFLVAGTGFAVLAWRAVVGAGFRWVRPALAVSIVAFAVSSLSGEPPDQVAMATKLVELLALASLARLRPGKLRRLAASCGVTALVVVTGVAAWAGAFGSGDGGHHLGEVPPPGVLLPAGEDRPPTVAEAEAADHLYAEVVAGTARFRDPAVAAAAGYRVAGLAGMDFHAENPAYKADGRILDPARPETLVYAVGSEGPVLLGALFEMPDIGRAGPAVGGPLTVWHAHDHVCFGVAPPSLAGLVSPFGTCPAGAIAIPVTPEMIHVWTVPGAPERFGDLDEAWLRAFLAS